MHDVKWPIDVDNSYYPHETHADDLAEAPSFR